jgi:hypothetical protein
MKTTANLTNPILILKQIPGSNTPGEPTPCGYETIRIWHFNVDGKGGALVTYDAETEFDLCFGEDLQYILCGHPVSGHRQYRPINLNLTEPKPKQPTMVGGGAA